MTRALYAAGLGALFCAACLAAAVAGPVEYASPEGRPAGYYPGLGATAVLKSELAAYLAKNQAGIADVQSRIVQIREGKRSPGCLGEDKYTCVATLAQKMAITDAAGLKDFNLFTDVRYDVNGRPLNGNRVILDGFIPNYRDIAHRSLHITVILGPGGAVALVEAQLVKGVEIARTQEEYDATGVYEIVAAMSAKGCPNLTRIEVARWVENTVKPSTHEKPKEHTRKAKEEKKEASAEGIHNFRLFDSPKLAFCGRSFQFTTATFSVRHGFSSEPAVVPTVRIQ